MPSYQVAHVNEQGQDIIFVPLESNFQWVSEQVRIDTINALQVAATSAGLRGVAVPCCYDGNRWTFWGPDRWRSFFSSLPPEYISQRINRTLSW